MINDPEPEETGNQNPETETFKIFHTNRFGSTPTHPIKPGTSHLSKKQLEQMEMDEVIAEASNPVTPEPEQLSPTAPTPRYLSELYAEIPSNCLFNKVRTGCGGTTLEIENMNRDSIITVPYLELIFNKLKKYPNANEDIHRGMSTSVHPTVEQISYDPQNHPNPRIDPKLKLLGVYDGIQSWQIKQYLDATGRHKIICTWDSLPRVIKTINKFKRRKLNDYFLLVDEFHCLTSSYDFRRKPILYILQNYTLFNRWCFMTATIHPKEFLPAELKEIEVKEAKLPKETFMIKSINTKRIGSAAKSKIDSFLNNRIDNAHIFVNSVDFISKMINSCNLNNDNCKAVWSKNNPIEKLGEIVNSNAYDPPKKINFYTSTSFEGCDIFDPEGRYIIISDNYKKHTLTDIGTSFYQIMGRIRNTRYNKEVIHIHNTDRNNKDQSVLEYQKQTDINNKFLGNLVELLNSFPQQNILSLKPYLNDGFFLKNVDGVLQLDHNRMIVENYKIHLYYDLYHDTTTLYNEQKALGHTVEDQDFTPSPSDLLIKKPNAKVNFKDTLNEYRSLKYSSAELDEAAKQRIRAIERKYKSIDKIATTFSDDELKELNYQLPRIKIRLSKSESDVDAKNNTQLIQNALNETIKLGSIIPSYDLKLRFTEISNDLGIPFTPMATLIDKFYNVQKRTRRQNGKPVECYKIISPKPILL